jgi:hypothetical protein
VIEVSAHDHFFDVRYHTFGDSDKSYYHNTIISPGISPVKGQNPGIAFFDIDASSMTPQNLRYVSLPLEQTYGWSSIPPVSSLPFRTVNFSTYGLYTLTAEALKDFKNKLEADDQLTYKYLVDKIGYDSSDST